MRGRMDLTRERPRPRPRRSRREPRPMKRDDRLSILAHAADLGLGCGGGACASIALAMNPLLFEGRGEVVAAVNQHIWTAHRVAIGHVGIRYRGVIWDAEGTFEGEDGLEEFLAWGMLDPDDLDYADLFPADDEAREAAAYDAVLLEGDEAREAARFLDSEGEVDAKAAILRRAFARWERVKVGVSAGPGGTRGSPARPNVALTPQVLTDPGDYFHPDARRFTWTPPPALPRRDPLPSLFVGVDDQDTSLSSAARTLSRRIAAQLAGGLQEVLPGVVPHLKTWTLQFTDKPSITAWTDPNRHQLRFGAHPLSAMMLLHEAVHVADSACYAGGGQDCFGGDAWASYDKRHPLGIFAVTLYEAWKESGEDERLLDRRVRQALSPLPLLIARALLHGEGVTLDAALEAISHQAGVPVRPATLRDALEKARSPFGGVDIPKFLSISGLPAAASRAVTAMASCLPVGVPFRITSERERDAYMKTLSAGSVRARERRYWMARHELLARYLDQYARSLLVTRGRWVPPKAPGSLPESVAAELAPRARAALREIGWTR